MYSFTRASALQRCCSLVLEFQHDSRPENQASLPHRSICTCLANQHAKLVFSKVLLCIEKRGQRPEAPYFLIEKDEGSSLVKPVEEQTR